jgi:2-polyprenyl-3-methyl-5-hydroxy-6-metoxy-1,4-benzoquinol methylase
MDADRERWEGRYNEAACLHGDAPSRFLREQMPRIQATLPGRLALDIACGEGRNALFLAQNGFAVTGVDIAETALERARQRVAAAGLAARFLAVDLDQWHPPACYDLILNINFLQRTLIPVLVAHLRPGGLLLIDTIMAGEALAGVHNPANLLAPGELSGIFARFPGQILDCAEFPDPPYPHAALLFQAALR